MERSNIDEQFKLTSFLADLVEINQELSTFLDLDPLLNRIAEATRHFVPYEVFAILLLDENRGELFYRFAIGHPEHAIRDLRVRLGEGIIGTAAREKRTMVIDDVSEDARYIDVVSGTQSELAIPLISKGRVLGVLDIESPKPAYFNEDHVRALNMLAGQVAIALENASLYESERRNREILSLLYDISLEVASTLDVNELIDKIAGAVKTTIGYDIFSILLLDESSRSLRPRMVFRDQSQSFEKTHIPLGAGLTGLAALEQRPIRVGNVSEDARYIRVHPETKSELVIPLAFKGRLIGVLDLESRNESQFTEYDERLLMTLATRIASALVNAELYEKVTESEQRLEQELAIARQIQLQLLPEEVGPAGPLELAVSFDSVAHLGGDHYDVIRFDDNRVAITVGDVSGKGAPAALYAALASGIIRTRATRKYPPAEMLELVNRTLQQRPIASQYIALVYAVFDPASGQLTLANAGLPYPIHVHGDDSSYLDLSGIPLGLFSHSTYRERTLELEENDIVVFYTDGIVERRNGDGEEYGLRRLAAAVLGHRREPPAEILRSIQTELEEFTGGRPAGDDQTMIVMKMGPEGMRL